MTIGAANAATRALSALVVAAIRMGYLPEPGDEYVRRRAERLEEVWGVELARMAERAGLTDDQFDRVLGRVADDARFQSGLALVTTNGREHWMNYDELADLRGGPTGAGSRPTPRSARLIAATRPPGPSRSRSRTGASSGTVRSTA